jgi:hypothetical protein
VQSLAMLYESLEHEVKTLADRPTYRLA